MDSLNDEHSRIKLAVPLFLGIAYSASIGGLGTPVGSPPNVIFLKVYAEATGVMPSFSQWMIWALPVVIFMIPSAGFWLTRNLHGNQSVRIPEVGQWRKEEVRVTLVFTLTAVKVNTSVTRTSSLRHWPTSGMRTD